MSKLKSLLAAAAICVLPAAASAQAGCAVPPNAKAELSELMQRINGLRASKGLNPLRFTATLANAAEGHACRMAVTGYWGHGGSPKSRMRAAGCRAGATGEAIAKGFRDGGRTFDLWYNSPGHYRIMTMRGATYAGLAVAVDADGGDPHWVLDVSNRC